MLPLLLSAAAAKTEPPTPVAATASLRTAQAALRAGASLAEVARAASFASVTLFSWRYYGYFGHWPTQDQPRERRAAMRFTRAVAG